jgi:hypothetical protein
MVTDPAWRTKPSSYLVTAENRMIPLSAQHSMAERINATLSQAATRHRGGPSERSDSTRKSRIATGSATRTLSVVDRNG